MYGKFLRMSKPQEVDLLLLDLFLSIKFVGHVSKRPASLVGQAHLGLDIHFVTPRAGVTCYRINIAVAKGFVTAHEAPTVDTMALCHTDKIPAGEKPLRDESLNG